MYKRIGILNLRNRQKVDMSDIENPLYKNWVRSALSLKYLKQGLHEFVDRIAKHHHKDLLHSYLKGTGLAAKSCNECTSENLLPEHPGNRCILKFRSKCFCNKPFGRRKCPNNFCSRFYDLVVLDHDERNPIWANSDPKRWFSDHWAMAQCYLGTTGYSNKHSAAETDASGLLSIILNNIEIRSHLDCPDNVAKARDIRNEILHTTSFEVEEKKMNMYIDQMISVLQDKKELAYDGAAQSAVSYLKQLKKDQIYISLENVSEMRKEALNAIQDGVKDIENKKYEVINSIEAKGKQIHDAIDEHFNKRLCEQEKRLEDKNVQTVNETDTGDVSGNLTAEEEDFQKYLIDLYLRDYVKVDISPLSTELDEDVEKVYVPLKAERVRPPPTEPIYQLKQLFESDTNEFNNIYLTGDAGIGKTTFCRKLISTWCRAKSKELSEVSTVFDNTEFYNRENVSDNDEDYEMFKDISLYDIYGESDESMDEEIDGDDKILGDADRLLNIEQQAVCNASAESISSYTGDQISVVKFDFLFFVSLRDTYEERSIEEMIKNQLLNDKFQTCFSNMISRYPERFLVILDGLDEWQPPSPLPTHPSVTKGLPLSSSSGSYTKITTTRPWKTESLRPKFRERDCEAKLTGIGEHGSQILIANLISKLSKGKNDDQTSLFLTELKEKDIEELKFVPLLVNLLVCLWCENGTLEKSKLSIYSSIVNLMILRAEEKCSENEHFKEMASAVRSSSCELLPVLNGFPKIIRYSRLFRALSRFAFNMLFRSKCGSMLVFKMNETIQYGLTEEDVSLCLYFGILSQKSVFRESKISKVRSVSFNHKTFQEYFSAMHISLYESDTDVICEVCDACKTIDQLYEMRSTLLFVGEMNPDALYKVLANLAILSELEVEIVDRTLLLKSKCINVVLTEVFMRANFQAATIYYTDFESEVLRLSDRMNRLDTLELDSVRMTHTGFKKLLESIPKSMHGITLKITCLTWNDDKTSSGFPMTITLQNLRKIYITGTDVSGIYMIIGQENHGLEAVVYYMDTVEDVALSKLINSIKPTRHNFELIVNNTALKKSSDECCDFHYGLMKIVVCDKSSRHKSTQFGNFKITTVNDPVTIKELTIEDTDLSNTSLSFPDSQKEIELLELVSVRITVTSLLSVFDAASNQNLRATIKDVDFSKSKYSELMSEFELLEHVRVRCICNFIPPCDRISLKYDISKPTKQYKQTYICATICNFAQKRYCALSNNVALRRQINQLFEKQCQLRSLEFVYSVAINNVSVPCVWLCTMLIAINDTFGYIQTFHVDNSCFDGNVDCHEWQQINEYRTLNPKVLTSIKTSSHELKSDRRYALLDAKTKHIIGPIVSDRNLDCIASFVNTLLGRSIPKTLIEIITGQTACLRATFKDTSIEMEFKTLNQQLQSTFLNVYRKRTLNRIDSSALSNLKRGHLNLIQQLKRLEIGELPKLKTILLNFVSRLRRIAPDMSSPILRLLPDRKEIDSYSLVDVKASVSFLLREIKASEYYTLPVLELLPPLKAVEAHPLSEIVSTVSDFFQELKATESATASELEAINLDTADSALRSEFQATCADLAEELRAVARYFKQ